MRKISAFLMGAAVCSLLLSGFPALAGNKEKVKVKVKTVTPGVVQVVPVRPVPVPVRPVPVPVTPGPVPPPGWVHGKKIGWQKKGAVMPPGLQKKGKIPPGHLKKF